MKSTYKNQSQLVTFFLLGATTAFLFGSLIVNTVYAQVLDEPTTVDVHVYKKIDGDTHGYSLSDFGFQITGGAVNATLSHDEVVALEPGTYTVEELVPVGFVKSDWRVGWYGIGCDAIEDDQYKGSITIEESDLGQFESPLPCEVNNQYRPNDDNGDGDNTGNLVVTKVIVGTSTSPENFSFTINNGSSTPFESDGENSFTVATGTYDIVETVVPPDYDVTYNNCSGVNVEVGSTTTCTITNTYDNGNGGGNGSSTDLYRIEGFVWHDADENKEKEGEENFLESWVVMITDGTTTATTSTNSVGYYYFDVEAGTWTITEVLQDGWTRTFPTTADGSHVVTVPVENEEEVALWFPFNLFFKVAQAAIIETYSSYNFGNFYSGQGGDGDGGGGGDGGDDDDNGGGSSGGSSGGGGGRGSGSTPTPTVLGNQVSVIPVGSPQGGFGGSAAKLPSFLAFLWPALAWFGF